MLETIRARISRAIFPQPLREAALVRYQQDRQSEMLLFERMAELEFALEDRGWQELLFNADQEFSRDGLQKIIESSRKRYLKNPLIRRGVGCTQLHVFGQGITATAQHPAINKVVAAFWDDPKNRAELTSHQALTMKEADLEVEGNIFFALFTDATTGRTIARTLPVNEVREIICDPEDARTHCLYRRQWMDEFTHREKHLLYPAWHFSREDGNMRAALLNAQRDGGTLVEGVRIIHLRAGVLSAMRFGVPEVYPALDWADAYKGFLENWATIQRSHARFAWTMKAAGGAPSVEALRAKLATTLGIGSGGVETNPAATTGSVAIGSAGAQLEPMRTAGSYEPAEGGRRLLLMVCAAFGLPESYFGDVQGTYATGKSLDRPTELKMLSRQELWRSTLGLILQLVIESAVTADNGALRTFGKAGVDPVYGQPTIEWATDADTKEPFSPRVDFTFPPIIEHDVAESIKAVVSAATLDGKPLAMMIDPETISSKLYSALSIQDADELLKVIYPDGGVAALQQQQAEQKKREEQAMKQTASANGNER